MIALVWSVYENDVSSLFFFFILQLLHEEIPEVGGLMEGGRVGQGGAPGQILTRSGRALCTARGQLRYAKHVSSVD